MARRGAGIVVGLALTLAGCAAAPTRDPATLEPACNRQCIVGHQSCIGAANTNTARGLCVRALNDCRDTCPTVQPRAAK
jgi:hypothetical protein